MRVAVAVAVEKGGQDMCWGGQQPPFDGICKGMRRQAGIHTQSPRVTVVITKE